MSSFELKCVRVMENGDFYCNQYLMEIPISLRALPDLVKSVWKFVRVNSRERSHFARWSHFPDEHMLVYLKCIMRVAELKVLDSYYFHKRLREFLHDPLPYPIALYVDAIGKFKVYDMEAVPVFVQHRIKEASGAINYSLTDLIILMKEFQNFRSVNDEIVTVARSIDDLPGVEWVEEDDVIKLSSLTFSKWTIPSSDDWRTFREINLRMLENFQTRRGFFRKVDVTSQQGSPVQAVRFPEPYNLEKEISYYMNLKIDVNMEKLAPILMLGYEHDGLVNFSELCGASDTCFKHGRCRVIQTQNVMFWVPNPEYCRINETNEPLGLLNSIKNLPLKNCIPSVRIPVSFRALPKIVKEVWDHSNQRDLNPWGCYSRPINPSSFQIFLKCIMFIAEIKLAHAQIDTLVKTDSLEIFYNLFPPDRMLELPYPIATFINHIGRFTFENQTVIPQLIEHEVESASGAINFSLSGIITLMKACSDFLRVDTPIVEIAQSAFNDLDAEVGLHGEPPLVEWERHPNDEMMIRISEASLAIWTLPSGKDVVEFCNIISSMKCMREKFFLWRTDLTAGLGSSVQAVRFPERLVLNGGEVRMYCNIPIPTYESNLAPALMLGYERNGRIFSRFCSSVEPSGQQGMFIRYGSFDYTFYNIMKSNEANRDPYYPSSDDDY